MMALTKYKMGQIMSFCWAVAEEQLIRIVGDAESKKRNGRLAETIVESID